MLIVVLAFFLLNTSQLANTVAAQENEKLNESLIATLLTFKEDQSKALAFLNTKQESLTSSLSKRMMMEAEKTINTSNISPALYFYSLAKYVADQVNDKGLQAGALYKLGWIYNIKKDFPKAIDSFTQSEQMFEELIGENVTDQMQARRLLSKVLYFHGRVYAEQDDLKNAIEFYTRSMKLCEETGSKADLLYNLYDLAPLYIRTGDYQKAKEVAQKSLSLSLDLEGSKETSALAARVKANAWEHLGFLTAIGGDDTLGLEYLQKALSLSMKLDAGVSQKAITAGILIDIGQVYHLISEYKQALNYYAQAMKIAQNLNNKTPYARVLTKLSALYEEQG
ncbi:MAG: tetratricopeptide repeat protein, partial [Pyrinomonadaceae bacterium]